MKQSEALKHLNDAAALVGEQRMNYIHELCEKDPTAVVGLVNAARSYLDEDGETYRPDTPQKVIDFLGDLKRSLLGGV
jgi:hypothetical protein